MQFPVSKVVMLCIASKALASPGPLTAVSVKDDGFPEVLNLKEMERVIADADHFTYTRDAKWQHHLDSIQEARKKVHHAVEHIKAQNKSQAGEEALDEGNVAREKEKLEADMLRIKTLIQIQAAKEKLEAAERSMFTVKATPTTATTTTTMPKKQGILSDHVMNNLDSNLAEARRQIQEARAKLQSEPTLASASDEQEEAQAHEAMTLIDDLLLTPNDLLPAPQSQSQKPTDKQDLALMDHAELEKLEQEMVKNLSEEIVKVDQFTKLQELKLQKRLDNIHNARSQMRESIEVVKKLKDPRLPLTEPMFNALQDVKQAKAQLFAEEQAMFSVVQQPKHPNVLSDHVMNNLDDMTALDEARQQIKEARARLAAEPPLFPEDPEEEIDAEEDHEEALKNIRRDIRKVRAIMAEEDDTSPVVRTQRV